MRWRSNVMNFMFPIYRADDHFIATIIIVVVITTNDDIINVHERVWGEQQGGLLL